MPIATKALARLSTHVNFSDSVKLTIWEEDLKRAVKQHQHPMDAADAYIVLCEYLQHPLFKDSVAERKKIDAIIHAMAHHANPKPFIDAIILIKKSGIQLNTASNKELTQCITKHTHPLTLAQAILYLFNAGLLEKESADTQRNIARIAPLAEHWFGGSELTKQLNDIPTDKFTQSLFDALLQISEESLDIKTIQHAISNLLCDPVYQEQVKIPSQADNSQRFRHYFLTESFYQSTRVHRSIQQDRAAQQEDSLSETEKELSLDANPLHHSIA